MRTENLNLLDLFSGIGGFHLGLERAGFTFDKVYNSDIDKFANSVYKYNFKESTNLGSVTDIQKEQLPKIHAITFGSPCQDFSLAGRRSGLKGNRSSLISEAIRLITHLRPNFFIWENVKGTFSSNNGEDFWAIIQAFTNIGGYRLEWQLLNTRWFLPQNRERIYLVGCLAGKSGSEIFPIEENGKRNNEIKLSGKKANKQKQGMQDIENRWRHTMLQRKLKKVKPVLTPNRLKKRQNGRRFKETGEDMFTLTGQDQHGIMFANKNELKKIEIIDKKGNEKNNQDYAAALCGGGNSGGNHSDMDLIRQNQTSIRRLTPVECERLQGFPDNWTQQGVDGPISDTQRYKQCGNAVTVDVVEAVGKKIYDNMLVL